MSLEYVGETDFLEGRKKIEVIQHVPGKVAFGCGWFQFLDSGVGKVSGLTATEMQVFLGLCNRMSHMNQLLVRQNVLCREFGMSPQMFHKALKGLKRKGVVAGGKLVMVDPAIACRCSTNSYAELVGLFGSLKSKVHGNEDVGSGNDLRNGEGAVLDEAGGQSQQGQG